MMSKTPVALFAYNRPAHTDRALQALARCGDLDRCEIHFYSDGPRDAGAVQGVEATREVLRGWAPRLGAVLTERETNLGLAKSVVSGVGELCEQFGRAVVLEDDLVVAPDFLTFMTRSLDRYQDDAAVMQVGGFTLAPPTKPEADAFFLPVTTTWGWATWNRAWKEFAWNPTDLAASSQDAAWKELFDLDGTGSFPSMLADRFAGKNDSWGILWWYCVSRRRGLVLYPTQSLVWNGGFDGSGVHCGEADFLDQGASDSYAASRLPASLRLPEVRVDPADMARLQEFFRSRAQPPAVQPRQGLLRGLHKPFERFLKGRPNVAK